MKLVDFTNSALEIVLPPDLMWVNEFGWSNVTTSVSWSINGALIVQKSVMQAGRPITLKAPDQMAWVDRTTLAKLYEWATTPTKKMRLFLEKANDSRQFDVIFDTGNEPLKGSPIKGWADHTSDDPYSIEIRLLTV